MPFPSHTKRGQLAIFGGLATAGAALLALAAPDLADAALKSAAGGGNGRGGFAVLTRYLDRIASFLVPVGGAAAVLGLIGVGIAYMAGNPQAGSWGAKIAIGLILVLGAKGLTA